MSGRGGAFSQRREFFPLSVHQSANQCRMNKSLLLTVSFLAFSTSAYAETCVTGLNTAPTFNVISGAPTTATGSFINGAGTQTGQLVTGATGTALASATLQYQVNNFTEGVSGPTGSPLAGGSNNDSLTVVSTGAPANVNNANPPITFSGAAAPTLSPDQAVRAIRHALA